MECLLSMYRGLRNGVMAGTRIRLPYILNALAYAAIFRTPEYVVCGMDSRTSVRVLRSQLTRWLVVVAVVGCSMYSRVKFVIKQLFFHGKNLGQFVLIYKGICCLLRNLGVHNGIESLIAGAVGGWTSFGTSGGVSGAVNEQITLYLFARGLEGLIRLGVMKGALPPAMDIRKPLGFKMLAAFSLALILYLTEYQPETLRPSFMGIMRNLYHESNAGPLLPSVQFMPVVGLVLFSMVGGLFSSKLSLQGMLDTVLGKK